MSNPKSTAAIAGHPIHPMLIVFPVAAFVGAFASDLAFWKTANAFWSMASLWMLGVGLIMAGLAAVMGLIDFAGDTRIRDLSAAWHHAIGNIAAVLIEFYNWYMRYQGEAVIPTGAILSGVVVLMLLYTGWQGWEMVYRHKVGVAD